MKSITSIIKSKFIYSALLIMVVLLSGCGVNSGLINQLSVNGANTNVVLEKKNFKDV